ncbi:hypothetical protein [Paenibacillus sp. PK3_47]|uniref:hypothetical protein n=1 Tax=Paenibacillus sp. PK3_47 TaxID=2072642 RepID=UPI00201E2463|nr:hypothetical protein [Paenibacillus sp. PK3_47]
MIFWQNAVYISVQSAVKAIVMPNLLILVAENTVKAFQRSALPQTELLLNAICRAYLNNTWIKWATYNNLDDRSIPVPEVSSTVSTVNAGTETGKRIYYALLLPGRKEKDFIHF